MWKIGFVGYSTQSFDENKAKAIIAQEMKEINQKKGSREVKIVGGYTALGIPNLAYLEAKKYGFKTVGIACADYKNYECFPCDEVFIIGNNWGDESKEFLNYCDTLIKIGGGAQSEKEYAEFTREKRSYPLESLDRKKKLEENTRKKYEEKQERQRAEQERRQPAEHDDPILPPEVVVEHNPSFDLLGGLSDAESDREIHEDKSFKGTYGSDDAHTAVSHSGTGTQPYRLTAQRGSVDRAVDDELDRVHPRIAITKCTKNDGSYLFGTRIMKCKLRNGHPVVTMGDKTHNISEYIAKFERVEEMKVRGLQSAMPLAQMMNNLQMRR